MRLLELLTLEESLPELKKINNVMLNHAKRWDENPTIADINGGDCQNWAYLAHLVIPGAELMTCKYFGAHAWVKINGIHYDAETTRGVADWRKLGAFKNNKIPKQYSDEHFLENLSEREFIKFWHISKRYIQQLVKKYQSST